MRAACGLTGLDDSLKAADHICDQIEPSIQGGCDLALVFATHAHAPGIEAAVARLRERLLPATLVGAITDGVVGGAIELESSTGMSVLACSGVHARAFAFDEVEQTSKAIQHEDHEPIATMLLADSSTMPSTALVSSLAEIKPRPMVGGLLKSKNGPATFLLDGQVRHRGAVGVSLSNQNAGSQHLHAVTLVSQGCTPMGENYVITRASRNILYELGGRPAVDVLRDIIEQMTPAARAASKGGVFLGRVADEYRERFGRGDYLIRGVARVLTDQGALALDDFVRVGQTVRFHMRDRKTADEDLALLLDGQKLHGTPAAVITLIGHGRGRTLFGETSHDARAISRAFDRLQAGPERAKPGKPIETGPGMLPMAGLFASGEIGPIAGTPYLHTQSVCALMIRAAVPASVG